YPVEPTDHASHAWNAGEGYGVLDRFARQAVDHIRPGWKLMIQISTEIDAGAVLPLFSRRGESLRPVASKRMPFETLSIYEISPRGHGS
ncbi:MAG TPA: hypothetical protein VMF59_00045, partial [Bacteroidota bacterium]|nr:hypothetical protein [Bacteroidota bacterium]